MNSSESKTGNIWEKLQKLFSFSGLKEPCKQEREYLQVLYFYRRGSQHLLFFQFINFFGDSFKFSTHRAGVVISLKLLLVNTAIVFLNSFLMTTYFFRSSISLVMASSSLLPELWIAISPKLLLFVIALLATSISISVVTPRNDGGTISGVRRWGVSIPLIFWLTSSMASANCSWFNFPVPLISQRFLQAKKKQW